MRFPRNTDGRLFRHIVIKVSQDQFLLTPSEQLNEIVGAVIAKYQAQYGIEIYSYCFLSNHFHMTLRAPKGNLWAFFQAVDREIAKRVNRLRKRVGTFWKSRYREHILPTVDDLLDASLYTVCNPVHHALVNHPKSWPGVNSYWQMIGAKEQSFVYTDWSAYNKAKYRADDPSKVRISDYQTRHILKLSVLPQFGHLAATQRSKELEVAIEKRTLEYRLEVETEQKTFCGRKLILNQDPFGTPKNVAKRRQPLCMSKSAEVRKMFKEWFLAWVEAYREASRRFRSGDMFAAFPPNCIKPSLLYRLEPV